MTIFKAMTEERYIYLGEEYTKEEYDYWVDLHKRLEGLTSKQFWGWFLDSRDEMVFGKDIE